MRRAEGLRRRALVAVVAALSLVLPGGLAHPVPAHAAAPDVRYVSPSGIAIDGSAADWDRGADFLADMYEAGKPDKRILSTSYARYDCATGTMYVLVEAVLDWVILPSDSDNFVKIGNSQKLVDGSYGANGTPPDFRYIGSTGWEASFQLAEGTYDGPTGLNIHAEVIPRSLRATSAVANRSLTVVIDCSQAPQPTLTPQPTPTGTPAATATPGPTGTPAATATPGPTGTPAATATPLPSASPTPDPTVTPEPTASPAPTAVPSFTPEPTPEPGRPPIIVGKINDKGTADPSDDVIAKGAVFEFRLDDGDKEYDAVADGPILYSGTATYGFLVWTPPAPGFYWVTETTAPPGLDVSAPVLVPYLVTREASKCVQQPDVAQACTRISDSVGYVFVVIADSPLGEIAPVTNPPTSTAPAPEPASESAPGFPGLLVLGGLGLALALLLRPGSRRRPTSG